MKLLMAAAVLTFSASLATAADKPAAASAADPVIGTWQLNVAHSKFRSGPALKSQTRTYTQSGGEITLVMKQTEADGKETTTQTTYHLDGKDYPVTGSADYDSLSGKQLNSHMAQFQLKKAGKVVGKTSRTVSHDGKQLTAQSHLTTADGKSVAESLVFDRQ